MPLLRDVAGHGADLCRIEFGRGRLQDGSASGVDHQRPPPLGQGPRQRQAKAARRSGDDRHRPVRVEGILVFAHGCSSAFVPGSNGRGTPEPFHRSAGGTAFGRWAEARLSPRAECRKNRGHSRTVGRVIELQDIEAAARRLEGDAHRTPVLHSRTLDERTGATAFLKAENFQRAGAFKFRGAFNRVSTLSTEQLEAGVVAYSSGNHAQAVALAARLVGTRATILMPADAPSTKVEASTGYGAEIIRYDRYRDDRAELAEVLAAERGLTLVAPYEDPLVVAGQGTAGLELLQQVDDLDVLIAPIGGGGLIAGCGVAAKAIRPQIQVVGVEPESGDDTKRSLETGARVRLPAVPRTIADGLQLAVPGELTFEINRKVVDDVVLVSDQEILQAMRFLFERLKVVVEPSGATPVAALLAGKLEGAGRRVGAILSGGNVGVGRFVELLGNGPEAPRGKTTRSSGP